MSSVADPQLAASLDAVRTNVDRLRALTLEPADVFDAYAIARELEQAGRQLKATQIGLLDEIRRRDLHRVDGHASPKVFVRFANNLSPAEACRRDAMDKVVRAMPLVGAAFADGCIGESQVERIARTLSNPRVRDALIEQDANIAVLAHRLPYVDFDGKLADWERLQDEDGARQKAERAHENRKFRIHGDYDGVHAIDGQIVGVPGAEMKAIHDHFRKKEWDADWAEARERLGDAATVSDLSRTEAQRSADAAIAAWRMANQAQADQGGSAVVVNVVIDDETLDREIHHACDDDLGPDPRADSLFQDAVDDLGEDPVESATPSTAADPSAGDCGGEGDGDAEEPARTAPQPRSRFRCHTEDGVPLHPSQVLAAALSGHVRRVVMGADSVVLDLGRLQRLFKGPQRAAVMLSGQRCSWVGCLVPTSQCQADHLEGFNGPRRGCTCPENGAPQCGRHNRLKEQGYACYRDERGRIHVLRPDGTEIC